MTFHVAIAEASGNPRFAELRECLGRHLIPRQSVRVTPIGPAEQRRYPARIQSEHARIHEASATDAGAARKTVRKQPTRSLARYRRRAERQMHIA